VCDCYTCRNGPDHSWSLVRCKHCERQNIRCCKAMLSRENLLFLKQFS
jgi:hypothetical protein